ncbi:MAG: type II toxin-antitoxin system PemK/MazF family toxin [Bacteroidia bacterium]
MKKGDIILVPFPFSDLTGSKLRPALVLSASELDVTVTFITTQTQWKESTDILIQASPMNGLKKVSLIRLSKLATLDKDIIVGRIGLIEDNKIKIVNANLKKILKLDD